MNNDFHNTYNLFELFKDLNVKDLDVEVATEQKPQPSVAVNEVTPEVPTKN